MCIPARDKVSGEPKFIRLPVMPYYTRPPRRLLPVNRFVLILCTVLQDGVDDLDGSLVGCVQWSPRQAQRGLLLCELC
jgi:hypothetical protein